MTLSQAMHEEPEPIKWLVPQWIAPGRPTLVYGAKNSGKSLAALDLFVSVVFGRVWLGCLPLELKGRAVYLDFEPKVPIKVRLRQILDFDPRTREDVGETDVLIGSPSFKLNDRPAQKWLESFCQGAVLLVVDGLAAACPGMDENDAAFRRVLDMLTSVSNKTGVCVVIVHHTGLKGRRPRGSTAISQACGTEILLTKTGNRFRMECSGPGLAGVAPETITVALDTDGEADAWGAGMVEHIRFRPILLKSRAQAASSPPKLETRPIHKLKKHLSVAEQAQRTDTELVAKAISLYPENVGTIGICKLANELEVGKARAERIREMASRPHPGMTAG